MDQRQLWEEVRRNEDAGANAFNEAAGLTGQIAAVDAQLIAKHAQLWQAERLYDACVGLRSNCSDVNSHARYIGSMLESTLVMPEVRTATIRQTDGNGELVEEAISGAASIRSTLSGEISDLESKRASLDRRRGDALRRQKAADSAAASARASAERMRDAP